MFKTVNFALIVPPARPLNNAFMGDDIDKAIDRLLAVAVERDMSEAELSRFLGHQSQQRLYNWKERDIPRAELLDVAVKMEINPVWLDKGTGPKGLLHSVESNVEEGPSIRKANFAPVTGRVRGGDGGYIEEEQYPVGYSDELVPFHGTDPNAFGLRVVGDSMSPRYKHGEFIVASPNKPCSQGQYVYVALTDGRKLVKQLGRDLGDAVELLSVNEEHKPLTILKATIAAMYRVHGPVESDAVIHR